MGEKDITHHSSTALQGFLETLYLNEGPDALVEQVSFLFGLFVVTFEGRVVAVNTAFAELVEYSKEELSGMKAVDLVVPEDRDDLARRFALNISERYPLRLLSKSGVKKYVTVAPNLFYIAGKPHRLAHFIDNTDLVNIQRAQIINFRNTASALTHAIEQRDPYTHGHMSRTAYIAGRMAKILGLDDKDTEAIVLGASLHDIGKISVPIEILTKPGRLASYEWAFIKKHPEIGYEILADVKFEKGVKDIVLLHHERQDGSGYPFGLSGEDIPLESAIVGVADCLEAIAGARPYSQSNSFAKAIEIIESEREKFTKELLRVARHLVFSEKLEGKMLAPCSLMKSQ